MRYKHETRDIGEKMYMTHSKTKTGGFVIEEFCIANKYTERTFICLPNTVHNRSRTRKNGFSKSNRVGEVSM